MAKSLWMYRTRSQSILSRPLHGRGNCSHENSCILSRKSDTTAMTNHPRYRGPAGAPYDWRYTQPRYPQPYIPQPNPPQAPPTMPPFGPPTQKRSRAGALTAGALAVAVVSAGVGGAVAVAAHPDHRSATTTVAAGPNPASGQLAASATPGTVEQVAAKVVPSVVKLET